MQFLVPDMQLYTLRCWSVDWYVGHIFEFLVFFASLLLPNHPRLDCRVSGLVLFLLQEAVTSVGRSNWKNGSGTNFLVVIPSPACAEMVFIAHRYFHKNHGPPRITKIHANQGKLFVHHPHVCKFVSSKRIELIGLILKNRRSSLK